MYFLWLKQFCTKITTKIHYKFNFPVLLNTQKINTLRKIQKLQMSAVFSTTSYAPDSLHYFSQTSTNSTLLSHPSSLLLESHLSPPVSHLLPLTSDSLLFISNPLLSSRPIYPSPFIPHYSSLIHTSYIITLTLILKSQSLIRHTS